MKQHRAGRKRLGAKCEFNLLHSPEAALQGGRSGEAVGQWRPEEGPGSPCSATDTQPWLPECVSFLSVK